MSKIKIKVSIINKENQIIKETNAIKTDDIIKYKETDNSLAIYNYNLNELYRENDELRMRYRFNENKKTEGNIFVKSINRDISIQIKTKKIKKENDNIEIEFMVENDKFLYKIEVIE